MFRDYNRVLTLRHSSVGNTMKGSFFNLGLTNSATKLNSWLSQRFSSSPRSRNRSARFRPLNCSRVSLMCESSCSAAVLQSGARCVGVGLGAGVGGEAGAEGSRLWCIEAFMGPGLDGVSIGRGAEDRDSLLPFRVWAVGDVNMPDRTVLDDAAAMSVSESIGTPGVVWPSWWVK